MKRILLIASLLLFICGCEEKPVEYAINDETSEGVRYINLDEISATIDGEPINSYDYTWSINTDTGEQTYSGFVNEDDLIYIAHDIVYYPEIDESEFKLENYNGEMEWARYYQNDELKDYIFSTLPNLKSGFPAMMMHSSEEAYENQVLHINEAGTYNLSGSWHGQINIDLGEDAYTDESKKVTLILDDVDVVCDVAPALIFKSVYESDNTWSEREVFDNNIDLTDAGACVIIKDGSINSFTGSNIYRLLKPVYKNESTVQKKLYKMDGAFYSFESMLIKGEEKGNGILNICSTSFEGLDSELHLQIDSGYINIVSYDDGINVNEDGVSTFVMNGGRVTIFAGQGSEGDVIDSNGYIKINGGTILGTSPSVSDSILDSDKGTEVSDSATIIVGGAMNNNFEMDFRNKDRMEFGGQMGMPFENRDFEGFNEFGKPFERNDQQRPGFGN